MNWPQTANAANEQPETSIDTLIVAWKEAKEAADYAMKKERDLRSAVVAAAFPQADEGTNTRELGQGWKLKATINYRYNLDKDQTEDALDKIEETGEDGKFVAERLVRWKPELSLTEYRQLAQKHKRLIDDVLTVKPGTPTLELVPPKG